MKSFAFAALAAVAFASNDVEWITGGAIVYTTGGQDYGLGNFNAVTSWESSGSGVDAAIRPQMWIWVEQVDGSFTSTNALTGPSCEWNLAFSSAEADAPTEVGSITWTVYGSVEVTAYEYGNFDGSIGDAADAEFAGEYEFITANGSVTARNNSPTPGTGFWKPTSANTVVEGSATEGNYKWGLGFTRDGNDNNIAGIAAGATVWGAVELMFNDAPTYTNLSQVSWAADTTVVEDTTTDDNTDTTGDDTTGDDTTGDDIQADLDELEDALNDLADLANDDGASALGYTAAIFASVYALAF